jgi:hypothetical protein
MTSEGNIRGRAFDTISELENRNEMQIVTKEAAILLSSS